MTDKIYRFQPFRFDSNKLGSFITDYIPDFDELLKNNRPLDILQHISAQASQADTEEDTRKGWTLIQDIAGKARESLTNEDFKSACLLFYLLGIETNKLSGLSNNELLELYKIKAAKKAQLAPLKARNDNRLFVKGFAQATAKYLWKHDKEKNIRIGEMCQRIWNELINWGPDIKEHLDEKLEKMPNAPNFPDLKPWDFMEALPDKPESLKNWLRPVAPSYAKKGGRPKS